MYTAIYRDFRPENFEQLVGQKHIVRILKNQIAAGTTGHAYLFCGTRGTGKTTTARILAKALNCEKENPAERPCCECPNCKAIREGSFMDVIEIDAASNNGVDNIRELRESVKYPPAMGRNKVYIIDEVHMLSAGAFNALLKTLEEPPEQVVFILATTEPQKLPATILSRCIRLDFRRVSEAVLMENMKRICEAKGVKAEEAALALIAVNADGSVRDSLSILEQCISAGDTVVTREDAEELLGTAGEETLISLTNCVMSADISAALLLLDRIIQEGRDVRQFMKEWLAHFRNLLMAKYIDHPERVLNMSLENAERVRAQSKEISTELLNRGITGLSQTIADARWSAQPRVLLEMCIVRLGIGTETEKVTVFPQDGAAVSHKQQMPSQGITNQTGFAPAAPSESAAAASMQPQQVQPQGVQPQSGNEAAAASDPSVTPEVLSTWKKVLQKASGERGALLKLEKKARLLRIEEKNIWITFDGDKFAEKLFLETGKAILEQKAADYFGRPLAVCLSEKKSPLPKPEQSEIDTKEISQRIYEVLGVKPEIK